MNKTLFKSSVIKINELREIISMNICKKTDDELITKISEILKDFHDFQKPCVSSNGDIIIKKNIIKREGNNVSVLTNIFKEIIKSDIKKNRV